MSLWGPFSFNPPRIDLSIFHVLYIWFLKTKHPRSPILTLSQSMLSDSLWFSLGAWLLLERTVTDCVQCSWLLCSSWQSHPPNLVVTNKQQNFNNLLYTLRTAWENTIILFNNQTWLGKWRGTQSILYQYPFFQLSLTLSRLFFYYSFLFRQFFQPLF